jgi:predicted dithiol-disulfide oxidoreductase (DUF899 family)
MGTQPEIVSAQEWRAPRLNLLAKEKEFTRARDALAAQRRRLPTTEITEDYRFTGPDGEVGLADLFEGRRQLLVTGYAGTTSTSPVRSRTCSRGRAR